MGSIQGTIVDGQTRKPVPSSLVIAVHSGAPAFSRNTRSGADGTFQIPGLVTGAYSLCIQAPGDAYLDPCQWNGSPVTVNLNSGQTVTGVSVSLTPASILHVEVKDAQNLLSQKTKDGRSPNLTVGVWGPRGIYYPVHGAVKASGTAGYQLAVPRDMALNFHLASRDLKLGDDAGVALAANASQQAFQHSTGDPNPKSFSFTILGLLP
jgi:hypothetical protein